MIFNKEKKLYGITLVEILLAVSIFFILIAVSSPIISQEWFNEENISTNFDVLASAMRLSRLKSIYAQDNMSHGVWLNGENDDLGAVYTYSGTNYESASVKDRIEIPDGLKCSLANNNLPLDINFSRYSGTTSEEVITISKSDNRKEYVINIDGSGVISKSAINK